MSIFKSLFEKKLPNEKRESQAFLKEHEHLCHL